MSFDSVIEIHQKALDALPQIQDAVTEAGERIKAEVAKGGKVLWMGNGGSAADAQHYAAELMVRYAVNRPPIPSIALTTDTSLLTAHSNDFEYETVFERQVEALAQPNDVVVGISTSGNSQNVLLALRKAKEKGALTVAMLGDDGGVIAAEVDIAIVVPFRITAQIQEMHLMIGHYWCDVLEQAAYKGEW